MVVLCNACSVILTERMKLHCTGFLPKGSNLFGPIENSYDIVFEMSYPLYLRTVLFIFYKISWIDKYQVAKSEKNATRVQTP